MQHDRYVNVSVSPKKIVCNCLMLFFGVERLDVRNLLVEDDAANNILCLRKITISSVAVACRRVGSRRVKSVPACKKTYYTKKKMFRTKVLL